MRERERESETKMVQDFIQFYKVFIKSRRKKH